MKKSILAIFTLLFACSIAFAGGGLDDFIKNLNIQARADMDGFSAKLSAQFGIPGVQVSAVIGSVREPADAFLCLQLGEWSRKPTEHVLTSYKANKSKGWGSLAKSLGIKPGSSEFHALKSGNLSFTGKPSEQTAKQGKGKGKGKGHDK